MRQHTLRFFLLSILVAVIASGCITAKKEPDPIVLGVDYATISFGANASASSSLNDWYTPEKAIDTLVEDGSRWISVNSGGDYLEIDLGAVRTIDSVKFIFDEGAEQDVFTPSYLIEYEQQGEYLELLNITDNNTRTPLHTFEPVDTQKVRITFGPSLFSDGKTRLFEVEVSGPDSGEPPLVNYALSSFGTTATASSSLNDSYVPQNLIDQDRFQSVSRWIGAQGEADWVELDFGEPREIKRVVIYYFMDWQGIPETAYVEDDTIEAFVDGEYQLVLSVAGNSLHTPIHDIESVTTDKVRITFGPSKIWDKLPRLFEIEVYGTQVE
ncbi:MAG: discoidin domain-containing protein [Limnochordia bacterium]|nr:discoidin domain-containing protein [Limnochordia bacterium]